MGKYDPGDGPYRVVYGQLLPEHIPDEYDQAKNNRRDNEVKWEFYSRLVASVKESGFRNPVLGWQRRGILEFPYGGSRAWAARHLSIPVPALICDWEQRPLYDDWEEIVTIEQALSKFTDVPAVLYFGPRCFQFWGCAQTHLDKDGRTFFEAMQRKNNAAWIQNEGVDEIDDESKVYFRE